MVVAQTNEQVDDLIDRLASAGPSLPIGRLPDRTTSRSPGVVRHPTVTASQPASRDLAGCPVVLGTAAKWALVTGDASWPWAIVDEAYQMRSDLLLRVAGRFERALFVGDPGQLDPFSAVETERWTGLTWDPMQSAVAVLLRHNPDIPRAPAAGVVAAARTGREGGRPRRSTPSAGSAPATGPGERRLEFTDAARSGTAPSTRRWRWPPHRAGPCTSCPPAHRPHRRGGGHGVRGAGRPPPAARRGRLLRTRPRRGAGHGRPDRGRRPRTGTRPRRSARRLPGSGPAWPGSPSTPPTACRAGSST